MDKILTVREPYASALVHGIKRFEYRSWRIQPGTKVWIHAGAVPGMPVSEVPAWLRSNGDETTASYIEWMFSDSDGPRPDISKSPLSKAIYVSTGMVPSLLFPFGKVIGWCVFGESVPTTGEECKFGRFANPVESFHALDPSQWRMHKGSLGLMPYGGVQ